MSLTTLGGFFEIAKCNLEISFSCGGGAWRRHLHFALERLSGDCAVRGHHVADKMTSTLILLNVIRKMRATLSARFYMVNIVSTEWAKGIERELNEN